MYLNLFQKIPTDVWIVICLLTSWFQTSAFPVQSQLILKSDPTLLSIEMRWGGFNVFLDQFLGEEQENNVFTRQHSTPSALRPELIIVLNCFQPKYSGRALPPIVLVQKCGLGATLLQRILAPGGRFGLATLTLPPRYWTASLLPLVVNKSWFKYTEGAGALGLFGLW